MYTPYTESMIYSNIPVYDITIASFDEKDGLACFMCSFGDMMESHYFAESTEAMIGHIEAHVRKGDVIPQGLQEQLLADDLKNYSKPTSQ
jgi:hypothetical protein